MCVTTTWSNPTTCIVPSPGSFPARMGSRQAPLGLESRRGLCNRITGYQPPSYAAWAEVSMVGGVLVRGVDSSTSDINVYHI